MKKTLLYLTIILSINLNANTFAQYQKECEANDGKGCHNFAVLYYQKGDAITALKYSDKSCNLGYPHGCVGAALVAKSLKNQEKVRAENCNKFNALYKSNK